MRKYLALMSLTVFLAACGDPEVPDGPPALTTPPDVATQGFLTAYTEQTIPMTVSKLRRFMEHNPLTSYLEPTENISNPVDSSVLLGTWATPGATRWLRLADGHYIIERVIENEPDFFKYQVFVFTNATGSGVDQIVGEQRFVPTPDGTQLQWTYNVLPKNFVTRQFVRANMDEIDRYITGGLQGLADAARATKN